MVELDEVMAGSHTEDMTRPRPEKRTRPRTGYVQVELTPEERAALEALRDRLSIATGQRGPRIGLAGVFRWLLHREMKRTQR